MSIKDIWRKMGAICQFIFVYAFIFNTGEGAENNVLRHTAFMDDSFLSPFKELLIKNRASMSRNHYQSASGIALWHVRS